MYSFFFFLLNLHVERRCECCWIQIHLRQRRHLHCVRVVPLPSSVLCLGQANGELSRGSWSSHNFLIASDSLNLTLHTHPYTPPLHNKLFPSHPCPWTSATRLEYTSRASTFRKQNRASRASLDKREANRRIPATTGFSFARADPRATRGPTALDGRC